MLQQIIEAGQQADFKVRGAALLCTGHLAAAVGRENFPPQKLE
jgi:hypothetical protein